MNQEQQRFHRALIAMEREEEEGEEPLDAALEERLTAGVLKDLAAQRARRRWAMGGAGAALTALALAAVLTLVMWPREALPEFTLEIGSVGQVLGDARGAGPEKFGADDVLTLRLRPQATLHDEVQVRTFVWKGGRLLPWAITPTRQGSVLVYRTTVGEAAELTAGAQELVAVVGKKGAAAPAEAEIEQALRGGQKKTAGGWQVATKSIEIGGR